MNRYFYNFLLAIFVCFHSLAQTAEVIPKELVLKLKDSDKDQNRTKFLSSNNYFGCELFKPNLKKGWNSKDPWIALTAQASYIRLGFGLGNAHKVLNEDTLSRFGNYKSIGVFYNYPIHILKNIITLEPEIGLDFVTAQFRDDVNEDPTSAGFAVSPALGVKVGPLKIVGKYTTSFAINLNKTNAWSGGMNYASLGVYFETGWGIMNPKRISSKGKITSVSQTEYFLDIDKGGYVGSNNYVAVYRVVTSYQDQEIKSVIHDVKPFWYIAPKVNSSMMINEKNGKTLQYGADLGFRMGFLGGDVFYQTGNIGFVNPISNDELKTYYGFVPDLNGTIQSNTYGGKIGIEIASLLTKIFVHSHENEKIYKATRFTRLLISYGIGLTEFTGKPVYNLANGEVLLDNYYSVNPNSKPINTAIQGGTSKSEFSLLSVKLEMGNVSLGYENYTYKATPFANGAVLTLGYMIPPGRLIQKIKAIGIARKIVKENKAKK